MTNREKEIVRKWFPVLLKEDVAFREEVMGYLTGVLATKDDIAKILAKLEEHSRILEGHSRILEEHSRILEGHSRILEEHSRILEGHTQRIEKFERTLTAIGARWGILAEDSFREGMKGILEDLGLKVSKWRIKDEEGYVLAKPSMVEADLLIKDGVHLLIEIKSSVSRFDIAGFKRIGELYEKREGIRPQLKVISPFIDHRAEVLAEELEIECYTSIEKAFDLQT